MKVNTIPFNIDLLIPTDNDVRNVKPVKVLDAFVGNTKNFHPDGLFSTDIFGKVGEDKRSRLYSYIDLRVKILHPLLFKVLVKLKAFYGEILSGHKFATFDNELKDFIPATPDVGQTGYEFFMSHFQDLKFEKNESFEREFNVDVIEKYRKNAFIDKLVVMPAGLRDYFIDSSGKPSEDEINAFYKRLIAISNTFDNVNVDKNLELLDAGRYNLQNTALDLYEYIKTLLEGKGKLIQGKWVTRAITNSTRNVISSNITKITKLNDPDNISPIQCSLGLHQYLRSTLPLTVKYVKERILSDIFIGPTSPVYLVDKKTLKRVPVEVSSKIYDSWMTYEGIEKLVATYGIVDMRHDIIEIEDHYLTLIYKGPDDGYKLVEDIEDVPKELRKYVSPITMSEFLYLSVFEGSDDIPGLITRYPVTGYGSINMVYCYIKTTIKSKRMYEVGLDFQPTGVVAKEFPIRDESFFLSMSIPHMYLQRMGGDFDGDCQ